jgi:hypothetical protein
MYSFTLLLAAFIFFAPGLSKAQLPPADTALTKTFEKVESEAFYPGGNEAWRKHVSKTMNPAVPSNDAPVGKYQVIAQFVVSKDGTVSDVKALTKFGYDMEEEVVRVIELSGKWTPAMQNGKPVNAYRRQPVTFIKDSDDFTIITDEPYTLYTNTDNVITIAARKVKAADIGMNVVGGSAVPVSDGKFIVRVKKPGRINIELVNSSKDDKEIGVASFEVVEKKL